MKTLSKPLILVLLITSLGIVSCSIFQKASKNSSEQLQSSRKKTEQIQTDQKYENKETQIYTFWSDSGLFQFQTIKEQISRKKTENTQRAIESSNTEASSSMERRPPDFILYAVIGFIFFGCFVISRKFWPP